MPGIVYSWTTNYNVWEEGSEVPYSLVIVDFPKASDIRMIGLYEGSDQPEVDQLVNVAFAAGPGGLTRPIFSPWTTL